MGKYMYMISNNRKWPLCLESSEVNFLTAYAFYILYSWFTTQSLIKFGEAQTAFSRTEMCDVSIITKKKILILINNIY